MSMEEGKFYASKIGAKNVFLKIKSDARSPP